MTQAVSRTPRIGGVIALVALVGASLVSVSATRAEASVVAGNCAQSLVDSRGPGDDFYNATYGSFYSARSFTAVWPVITEVGTWMYSASDEPLTFTLIEGSSIGGSVVASVTENEPGGVGKVGAVFPTPVAVEPGETYILKINSPSATTGITWNGDATGSTGYYDGGTAGTTTTTAPRHRDRLLRTPGRNNVRPDRRGLQQGLRRWNRRAVLHRV